jgi:hypothetical protein
VRRPYRHPAAAVTRDTLPPMEQRPNAG